MLERYTRPPPLGLHQGMLRNADSLTRLIKPLAGPAD
jgi:hypothetical protein